jgi:hypothetical protein
MLRRAVVVTWRSLGAGLASRCLRWVVALQSSSLIGTSHGRTGVVASAHCAAGSIERHSKSEAMFFKLPRDAAHAKFLGSRHAILAHSWGMTLTKCCTVRYQ